MVPNWRLNYFTEIFKITKAAFYNEIIDEINLCTDAELPTIGNLSDKSLGKICNGYERKPHKLKKDLIIALDALEESNAIDKINIPIIDNQKLKYTFRKICNDTADDKCQGEMIIRLLILACESKQRMLEDNECDDFFSEPQYNNDDFCKKAEAPDCTSFLQQAKSYFDGIKDRGRFKGYFPEFDKDAYIKDIHITLKSGGSDWPFEKILFPDDDVISCSNSVSLCGKGGIGKTFLILHMIDLILRTEKYPGIIPLYIELQTVISNYNGDVLSAIAGEMEIELSELKEHLLECKESSNRKILIFADGMNEVVGEEARNKVASSITSIRESYNCRFVVSSRENHVGIFNNLGRGASGQFESASVNLLNPEQIKQYLANSNCNVNYDALLSETKQLLRTPQGLSMFSELEKKNTNVNFKNLGSLILAYSDMLLHIDRENAGQLSFEITLEEIAYEMVRNNRFECKNLSEEQLKKLEAQQNYRSIFVSKQENTSTVYTFSHQNFRDVYCARFIARRIEEITPENIEEIFSKYFTLTESSVIANDEILELVSAFTNGTDEKAIKVLREWAKTSDYDYAFALSRLIRIYAFRNQMCIAELDLSKLDLRKVSLSGYKLYDEKNKTEFSKSKISNATFTKQGLQTASSTVASYVYDGKTYVAAFAATSILIVDTTTNHAQSIQNLESYDWVNCCCLSETKLKDGTAVPVIYLGHKSGTISAFYPHKLNTDSRLCREKIFDKNSGSVFSIFAIPFDGEDYIVFSAENGYIYALNENTKDVVNPVWELPGEKGSHIPCCITYSKEKNVLFAAYQNKMYILDCNKKITDASFAELEPMKPEKDSIPDKKIISDIIVLGKYIFVNVSKEIFAFEYGTNKNGDYKVVLRKSCNINDCFPNAKNDSEFTSFSQWREDHITVGIKGKFGNHNDDMKKFYDIKLIKKGTKYAVECEGIGGQYTGMATHTCVGFDRNGNRYLAGVSNNRSLEICVPQAEEIPHLVFRGTYDGVHSIDSKSEENQELLCANYDGSVTRIALETEDDDFNESESLKVLWAVKDVYPIHSDWAWKVVYFGENQFISCSYDGKLCITDMESYKSQCLIHNANEKLLDFCICNEQNVIWAISERILYKIQFDKKKETWNKAEYIPVSESKNINLRAIAIEKSDNTPIVFYNEDAGTPGHLVKISNIKSDILTLSSADAENNYPFIRKMEFNSFQFSEENKKTYLIAVGNIGKKGYVLFAEKDGLEYHASEIFDNIGSEINDFAVTKYEEKYILWLAHKNHFIDAWEINFDSKISIDMFAGRTKIQNDDLNRYNGYAKADKMEDQPMCLKAYDDEIYVGLLNGSICELSIDSGHFSDEGNCHETKGKAFHVIKSNKVLKTHANLISCYDVSLSDSEYDEKLPEQMKGYFTFE